MSLDQQQEIAMQSAANLQTPLFDSVARACAEGLEGVMNFIIHEGPGMLGRAAGACASGMARAATSVGAAVSDAAGSMASRMGGIAKSPDGAGQTMQVAQAAPAVEQAPALGQFDVDPCEIGCMSAPTFGGSGVSQDTGIGV